MSTSKTTLTIAMVILLSVTSSALAQTEHWMAQLKADQQTLKDLL